MIRTMLRETTYPNGLDQHGSRLGCIVFELLACENSAEFPAESGCKANDLTRYKVDTARRVLPYI